MKVKIAFDLYQCPITSRKTDDQAVAYMERHLLSIVSLVYIFHEFVFGLKFRLNNIFIHDWLSFQILILFTPSHTFFIDHNVTIDDIRIFFFVTFASRKYTMIFVNFDTSNATSFSDLNKESTIGFYQKGKIGCIDYCLGQFKVY